MTSPVPHQSKIRLDVFHVHAFQYPLFRLCPQNPIMRKTNEAEEVDAVVITIEENFMGMKREVEMRGKE